MVDVRELFVSYLTGDFLYSAELQAFWMAFQGMAPAEKTCVFTLECCMLIFSLPGR